jgi:hypothetical protein
MSRIYENGQRDPSREDFLCFRYGCWLGHAGAHPQGQPVEADDLFIVDF